eukprot:CAMPEP_0115006080 /NCGR_PEP_ID=MMETSP0216-20121206/20269_1 /TAXON_ID=223996 /ORGANISM="Protocruzia adherens, Strain Boccale" /LENGTH=112 /DNA_ID=CAMNT_0002372559 /DNA_START=36 /DNA_END=374 /DNA_ORIENTATION=+
MDFAKGMVKGAAKAKLKAEVTKKATDHAQKSGILEEAKEKIVKSETGSKLLGHLKKAEETVTTKATKVVTDHIQKKTMLGAIPGGSTVASSIAGKVVDDAKSDVKAKVTKKK